MERRRLRQFRIVQDGYMITPSGIVFDLWDPNPDEITIHDIAHGLANTCRWNGATLQYFSVAQHSCMMSDLAPAGQELKYLFHDAEEAYWGDIIRPVKNMIKRTNPDVIDRMTRLRMMIYEKYKIPYIDEGVRELDNELLEWEYDTIIRGDDALVDYWTQFKAEKEFMIRYSKSKKQK